MVAPGSTGGGIDDHDKARVLRDFLETGVRLGAGRQARAWLTHRYMGTVGS